jgi:sugar transferase EpsL
MDIYKTFGKRQFDIAASASSLVCLSPIIIFVWVFVRLSLGTPVVFKHKRPGLQNKSFILYKFRTMTVKEKDEFGKELEDEQRLDRFGKFLRSTSLDELPELWNVLQGDMSLVGPRPLLMEYLNMYSPEECRRHNVRPGLTGWAQIKGRNAISFTERFKHDVWYVDNYGFLLDLKILLLTIGKVVSRKGIEQKGGKNEILKHYKERCQ